MICNKITYPQRDTTHVTHYCYSSVQDFPTLRISRLHAHAGPHIHPVIVMDFLRWNFFFSSFLFHRIVGRSFLIIWTDYVETLTIQYSARICFVPLSFDCCVVRSLVKAPPISKSRIQNGQALNAHVKQPTVRVNTARVSHRYVCVCVSVRSCMYSINSFNLIVTIFFDEHWALHS